MLAVMNGNVCSSLADCFAKQWHQDMIYRTQQTTAEIIKTETNGSVCFYFHPCVTTMQVVSLWEFKPADIDRFNWLYNSMHGILILKVLIKVTIPAGIIVRARSKGYSFF